MARRPVAGEKPLYWVGSSKRDLVAFPEPVKDRVGTALSVAQFGGKHPAAKPWKGQGPGVLEVVEDHDRATFRGKPDIELVSERLRMARRDYEARHGKADE